MKKKSWVCTLITQLSLCFALFLTLQIGHKQKPIYKVESESLNLYFISVRGGFRPLQEQSNLLKQIEKVIKAYNARFVINISELGENDPHNQNATRYIRSFNVPWYATKYSKISGDHYFSKKVKASNGNSLDVFFLNTGLFQDNSSASTSDQLNWLESALKTSDAQWRIIVGFHPILACNRTNQANILGTLYDIFLKNGVNAYISGQECSISSREGDIANITGAVTKGPYLMTANRILNFNKMYKEHDFLLHRVNPLEMVTYFVTLDGEVVHKIQIRQLGLETM